MGKFNTPASFMGMPTPNIGFTDGGFISKQRIVPIVLRQDLHTVDEIVKLKIKMVRAVSGIDMSKEQLRLFENEMWLNSRKIQDKFGVLSTAETNLVGTWAENILADYKDPLDPDLIYLMINGDPDNLGEPDKELLVGGYKNLDTGELENPMLQTFLAQLDRAKYTFITNLHLENYIVIFNPETNTTTLHKGKDVIRFRGHVDDVNLREPQFLKETEIKKLGLNIISEKEFLARDMHKIVVRPGGKKQMNTFTKGLSIHGAHITSDRLIKKLDMKGPGIYLFDHTIVNITPKLNRISNQNFEAVSKTINNMIDHLSAFEGKGILLKDNINKEFFSRLVKRKVELLLESHTPITDIVNKPHMSVNLDPDLPLYPGGYDNDWIILRLTPPSLQGQLTDAVHFRVTLRGLVSEELLSRATLNPDGYFYLPAGDPQYNHGKAQWGIPIQEWGLEFSINRDYITTEMIKAQFDMNHLEDMREAGYKHKILGTENLNRPPNPVGFEMKDVMFSSRVFRNNISGKTYNASSQTVHGVESQAKFWADIVARQALSRYDHMFQPDVKWFDFEVDLRPPVPGKTDPGTAKAREGSDDLGIESKEIKKYLLNMEGPYHGKSGKAIVDKYLNTLTIEELFTNYPDPKMREYVLIQQLIGEDAHLADYHRGQGSKFMVDTGHNKTGIHLTTSHDYASAYQNIIHQGGTSETMRAGLKSLFYFMTVKSEVLSFTVVFDPSGVINFDGKAGHDTTLGQVIPDAPEFVREIRVSEFSQQPLTDPYGTVGDSHKRNWESKGHADPKRIHHWLVNSGYVGVNTGESLILWHNKVKFVGRTTIKIPNKAEKFTSNWQKKNTIIRQAQMEIETLHRFWMENNKVVHRTHLIEYAPSLMNMVEDILIADVNTAIKADSYNYRESTGKFSEFIKSEFLDAYGTEHVIWKRDKVSSIGEIADLVKNGSPHDPFLTYTITGNYAKYNVVKTSKAKIADKLFDIFMDDIKKAGVTKLNLGRLSIDGFYYYERQLKRMFESGKYLNFMDLQITDVSPQFATFSSGIGDLPVMLNGDKNHLIIVDGATAQEISSIPGKEIGTMIDDPKDPSAKILVGSEPRFITVKDLMLRYITTRKTPTGGAGGKGSFFAYFIMGQEYIIDLKFKQERWNSIQSFGLLTIDSPASETRPASIWGDIVDISGMTDGSKRIRDRTQTALDIPDNGKVHTAKFRSVTPSGPRQRFDRSGAFSMYEPNLVKHATNQKVYPHSDLPGNLKPQAIINSDGTISFLDKTGKKLGVIINGKNVVNFGLDDIAVHRFTGQTITELYHSYLEAIGRIKDYLKNHGGLDPKFGKWLTDQEFLLHKEFIKGELTLKGKQILLSGGKILGGLMGIIGVKTGLLAIVGSAWFVDAYDQRQRLKDLGQWTDEMESEFQKYDWLYGPLWIEKVLFGTRNLINTAEYLSGEWLGPAGKWIWKSLPHNKRMKAWAGEKYDGSYIDRVISNPLTGFTVGYVLDGINDRAKWIEENKKIFLLQTLLYTAYGRYPWAIGNTPGVK